MLINHPTDGATHGLTLEVRLLGRKKVNVKLLKWLYYSVGKPSMPIYTNTTLFMHPTLGRYATVGGMSAQQL